MLEYEDFLEVIYDEFGSGEPQQSGAFRLIAELAHEGEYGVVSDVLRALVDDGHADVASELFREVCFSSASSSVTRSQGPATACMLVGEMLSGGYELQVTELLDQLVISEELCDNPDTTVVVAKMVELGYEDWVVRLCKHLFYSSSSSLAIMLGEMVDHNLLYLASRICLQIIGNGDIACDAQKLTAIRAKLLEADHDGCLQLYEAMDSHTLHAMDVDVTPKLNSFCGSQEAELTDPLGTSVRNSTVTEAY